MVEEEQSKYFTVKFQYPSVLNHVVDFTASETMIYFFLVCTSYNTLLLYWARPRIFSEIFLIKVENRKRRMAYSIIIPHKNSAFFVFIYLSCKKKSRLNHGKNGSPVYHNNNGTEEILTHYKSCTFVSKVLTILIRLFSPSFPRLLFSRKYHFLT